jgi:hypothetical protein
MVLSPAGLKLARSRSNSKLQTCPLVREGNKIPNAQLSKENFKTKQTLVTGSDRVLAPGQTGRLTVGHKITLTFTNTSKVHVIFSYSVTVDVKVVLNYLPSSQRSWTSTSSFLI